MFFSPYWRLNLSRAGFGAREREGLRPRACGSAWISGCCTCASPRSRKLEEAGDLETFVGYYVTGGYGRTVERYRCETEVTKS